MIEYIIYYPWNNTLFPWIPCKTKRKDEKLMKVKWNVYKLQEM